MCQDSITMFKEFNLKRSCDQAAGNATDQPLQETGENIFTVIKKSATKISYMLSYKFIQQSEHFYHGTVNYSIPK